MNSLFPDMEREIRDDRRAARREMRQRAREYLSKRDLVWLINCLLERGPTSEHALMIEAMGQEYHSKDAMRSGLDTLQDLYALWLVRKLWRRKLGIHPGSGEMSFEYGLRGVHKPQPS